MFSLYKMEKINQRNAIKHMLNNLTFDEINRAWDLLYKWGERTMKERGARVKDWKKWRKDNKQRGKKCDKYFPTISVEEGREKFKEIVEKIMRSGYYGL